MKRERQIMMTVKRFFVTSALAAAVALPVFPYNDTVTHPQLTVISTQKSSLFTDPSRMLALGLQRADRQLFQYRGRVEDVLVGSSIYTLDRFVAEGSFDEDAGSRALNHFYDPFRDRPLTFLGERGKRSWEWVLELPSQISDQDRSLADARTYLVKALTFNTGSPAESDNQRGLAYGSLFLSLGHAMHHMQDMTQPQHVRNDIHLDRYPILIGLYDPSRYEKYAKDVNGRVAGLAAGGTPVFPGSSDYKVPKDFWTNSAGSGVAQFTNRSFVSKRTNFLINGNTVNVGNYPLPVPGTPAPATVQDLFAAVVPPMAVPPQIQTLCGNPAIDCSIMIYPTATSQKASTLSIFDQDLRATGVKVVYPPEGIGEPLIFSERLFALNNFNFADALPTLIPKAVGYSAGLINHFLRGKLEVTPPTTGPYAVVDHASGNGFTTIKCKVANATPNEALSGGSFRAIAKFHRNGCYQSDLSGEFQVDDAGNLITPCPNFRSQEAHLRMTASQSMSFGVGEQKDMTLTFTEAIPFDATDLIIQVLYEGTVGTEQNTFAIGAVDVSEPTYFTVMNGTDTFALNPGGFQYYTDIIAGIADPPFSIVDIDGNDAYNSPPDVNVTGCSASQEILINNKKVADTTLPEGRFSRIAVLVAANSFRADVVTRCSGLTTADAFIFGSKTFQYDPVRDLILVSVVGKLRSQALHFDSVTYFHFYPTIDPNLNLRTMPPSRDGSATTLIPVTLTPQ